MNKVWGCRLNLFWSGLGPVAHSCLHDAKYSSSSKDEGVGNNLCIYIIYKVNTKTTILYNNFNTNHNISSIAKYLHSADAVT
jgi:hypothetical protein